MRPHKSASHETCRPRFNAVVLLALLSTPPDRFVLLDRFTVGERLAPAWRASARARSKFAEATCKLRFFSTASSTSAVNCGSLKDAIQLTCTAPACTALCHASRAGSDPFAASLADALISDCGVAQDWTTNVVSISKSAFFILSLHLVRFHFEKYCVKNGDNDQRQNRCKSKTKHNYDSHGFEKGIEQQWQDAQHSC